MSEANTKSRQSRQKGKHKSLPNATPEKLEPNARNGSSPVLQGQLSPSDHASHSSLEHAQGLLVSGYAKLRAATYVLLSINNAKKSRRVLQNMFSLLTFHGKPPLSQAVNIALTYEGLKALQLPKSILSQFSDAFRSGMTTEHKQRILGDAGANAPEHWEWGGPDNRSVDILLLCYAEDDNKLEQLYSRIYKSLSSSGMDIIKRLETSTQDMQSKEHFGFKDGIGQPFVAELTQGRSGHTGEVPLGEFLLGYPNGYGRYTQRPLIDSKLDPQNLLPPDPEGSQRRDLGKNGTYLVFRQLAQDVPKFWRYMQRQNKTAPNDHQISIALASKMVGRWPSGAPLVLSPEQDKPEMMDKDAFAYHKQDAEGFRCPLGAHIRRTHPRDSLPPEPGTDKSLDFSNRHRMIRRGRTYGAPFHPSLDPEIFLKNLSVDDIPGERGLHFICLNANIGRQFEFIQHTWANNPNFNGLYADPDPIIGAREAYGLKRDQFTVQQCPARKQLHNLENFVTVKGGAYFFLPSRAALQYVLQSGD